MFTNLVAKKISEKAAAVAENIAANLLTKKMLQLLLDIGLPLSLASDSGNPISNNNCSIFFVNKFAAIFSATAAAFSEIFFATRFVNMK